MSILNPFQLLELNVISAQDLTPVSRSMRTYAVAWVHPDRKLSTRVDTHGHNNPTWNDKFVFRVDEDFLRSDTSAVMIEIYALHWFKDVHVGTVRILVGNLIPTPQPRTASPFHNPRPHHHHYHHPQLGMRFVALQVRRASGRPQGILNIGVALLHSAMRSMPLYSQLSTSAVGYRELMGEEDPIHHHNHNNSGGNLQASTVHLGLLSELRRTKSDVSSMIGSENRANEFRDKGKNGKKSNSMVNGSDAGSRLRRKGRSKGGSSLLSSVSGRAKKSGKGRQRKSSSVINGSEVSADPPKKGRNGKASSLINGNSDSVGLEFDPPKKGKNGKVGSLINGNLEVGALDPPKKGKSGKKGGSVINGNSEVDEEDNYHYYPPKKVVEIKPILKPSLSFGPEPPVVAAAAMPSPRVKPSPRFNLSDRGGRLTGKSPFHPAKFQTPVYEYGTPRKSALMVGGGRPFLTESELGPSPSEVAAAIAKQPVDESESSILEGWSVDESVEGLRSKLERWRTELPPVYDRGEFSSYPSSESRHARRHTDGGNGLFSCFSNICGVECSIVCGSGGGSGSKKSGSGRVIRSPSAENINNYK